VACGACHNQYCLISVLTTDMGPSTASDATMAEQQSVTAEAALWSGAQAVLEIMFLNAVGVVLAWYPRVPGGGAGTHGLLDQPTIARLSRLSVRLNFELACRQHSYHLCASHV